MRLFVAHSLPHAALAPLVVMRCGVPGARWQCDDQLHLTLRFIGEVDGAVMAEIDDALAQVEADAFSLALKGVGCFGGNRPHTIWLGVADEAPLHRLHRQIENALQRIGLAPDTRKFTPHVTLARLKAAPTGAVMDYLTDHALFAGASFVAESFALYSSLTTPQGSVYRRERCYPLRTGLT